MSQANVAVNKETRLKGPVAACCSHNLLGAVASSHPSPAGHEEGRVTELEEGWAKHKRAGKVPESDPQIKAHGREDEQSSVHCTLVGIQSIWGDGQLCPAWLCTEQWQCLWKETVTRVFRMGSLLPCTHFASVSSPCCELWVGTQSKLPWRANQENGRTDWLREGKSLTCKSM